MKTKLNITIEQNLLEKVKVYAIKKQVSVSILIEDYLKIMVQPTSRRKNILDIVDKLRPNAEVVSQSSNKELFYENQREKYGFNSFD